MATYEELLFDALKSEMYGIKQLHKGYRKS